MGKYVNNGVVTLEGNVDYDDAVREIATLVGVGRRGDGDKYAGRFVLADVVNGSGVNMWAKYKPQTTIDKPLDITDSDRKANRWAITWAEDEWERNSRITLLRGGFPVYEKGDKWKRLKDFNGYDHYAKPAIQIMPMYIGSDVGVQFHAINVLPYENSLQNISLYEFKDIFPNCSLFTEVGWMLVSYTGFILHKEVLGTSYDDLISYVEDADIHGIVLEHYYKYEPKGYDYEGRVMFYGKLPISDTEYAYQQIGLPAMVTNFWGEEVQAYIAESLTPDTKIGTLTTGLDKSINDWQDSGEPIMFATDDLLYINFSAYNPSSKNLPVSDIKLLITVKEGTADEATYTTSFFRDVTPSSGNQIVVNEQYIGGHLSRGNMVVDLTNLYLKLGASSALASFDATFQIMYKRVGLPLITNPVTGWSDAFISSKFKLKLRCTGDTLNEPILPNPDLRPVPPNWDVEYDPYA